MSIMALFVFTTLKLNLPIDLLSSICFIESGHVTSAVNKNDKGSDSVGICQMKHATAKMLGFRGTLVELKQPDINVYYAGLYLKKQLTRYNNNSEKAISAYNAGRYIKTNRAYVTAVKDKWKGVQYGSY